MATTGPPTLTLPPMVAGTTVCGSVAGVRVAMSVLASVEATVADDVVPSENTMLIAVPSDTTWAAVTTSPLSDATTPVPSAPFAVRTTATDGPTWSKMSETVGALLALALPLGVGAAASG